MNIGFSRRAFCTLLLLLFCLSFPARAQQAVASYTFDDGTASDGTGNGNDGILRGNPQPEEGIRGLALRFNGQADGILVPDDSSLDTENVSLSAWVRLDGPPARSMTLLQKLSGDTGYTLRITAMAAVQLDIREGGSGFRVTAPFPVIPDVWTAISANYDGTDLRLYLHGSLVAKTSAVGLDSRNDAPVKIGRGFRGLMDEVEIGPGGITAGLACATAFKIWAAPSLTCLDTMTDVTDALGVADLEHLTFGATLVDINQDGWIDLYYVNGFENPQSTPPPVGDCPILPDPPVFPPENRNVLYMNRRDGTFHPDSAPEAGIDDPWNAMRNIWADIDNDGRRDLFSHNFLVSTLYRSVSGPDPLVFEDANDASDLHVCLRNGTGASAADIDNDGFLDLYAVEYDPNRPAVEHRNQLFRNNGDGTFREITRQAGLDLVDNPMGQVFFDFDNDGDQDVFVTNSHEVPSRLYRNDGIQTPPGFPTFTDVGAEAGVAVTGEPDRGFGSAVGDFNNDGLMDLLFIREGDSRLFRNDGPDGGGVWRFADVTGLGGLDLPGFIFHDGTFADLNNDGWQDLVLANADGPNQVFLNNQDGTWNEVSLLLGMRNLNLAQRGVVPGDIDNDGDLDIVFTTFNLGFPNTLYRNEARGNNWVQFRLTGVFTNVDAVGARIEITAALLPGGPPVRQIREIFAGTGFFSDSPRIQTFGLGKAREVLSAQIRWPSGIVQTLGPLPINQRHDVLESP